MFAAGEDIEPAIGLDADEHGGIDKAQAFGARAREQEAGAGETDLGLRRDGDGASLLVADHHIDHADGRAPLGVAFELGAADADAVVGRRNSPQSRP